MALLHVLVPATDEPGDWSIALSADSAAVTGRPLAPGEEIRAANSLTLVSPRGAAITLAPRARARIPRERRSYEGIELLDGLLRTQVPPGSDFRVTTPVATIGVRGTDFAVGFEEEDSREVEIAVFERSVWVEAGGRTVDVGEEREARAGRSRAARSRAMRAATRERFARFQERMADALIERFDLPIQGDADLREVLRRIPEAVRERIRNNVETRRHALRAALARAGADAEGLSHAERFRKARDAFERQDAATRDRHRREASRFFRDLSTRFRRAADDVTARHGARGDTIARAFRRWADGQDSVAERISRMREPRAEVSVDPPRGLAHRPLPALAENHPFLRGGHAIRATLRVGPLGAVRGVEAVEISSGAGVARREAERWLRSWRFDEVPAREGVKRHRVEIRTIPD